MLSLMFYLCDSNKFETYLFSTIFSLAYLTQQQFDLCSVSDILIFLILFYDQRNGFVVQHVGVVDCNNQLLVMLFLCPRC